MSSTEKECSNYLKKEVKSDINHLGLELGGAKNIANLDLFGSF